jgi:hypothetical protein
MTRWKHLGRSRRKKLKKKRKVSAVKVVRLDAGGDKSDQAKDLAKRRAAVVASVTAARQVLEALMELEPNGMEKLTPMEAAEKPKSKPVPKPAPAPKKMSAFKPLPVAINISLLPSELLVAQSGSPMPWLGLELPMWLRR